MLKKLKIGSGPIEYTFLDPDTQYIYVAANLPDLVKHIVTYRSQNELEPIENLDMVLEDYWCGNPKNFMSCCDRPLERSFVTYIKGGIALVKNLLFKKFVSKLEAESRASLCFLCPKNVILDSGPFQDWANEVMVKSIGTRQIDQKEKLGICACCECVLRAKVWTAEKISLTQDEKKCMPEFCWQLEEVAKQNG